MPQLSNPDILRRYNQCNSDLITIIKSIRSVEEENVRETLSVVNNYYLISLMKADSNKRKEIIEEYEDSIFYLRMVQEGHWTAEQFEAEINSTVSSRKVGIVFYNIAKVLEMLFWASATVTCYTACVVVGIPLILTDFLIGMAVTIATGALMYKTLKYTADCFEQFKSTERHEAARVAQNTLASFFKPKLIEELVDEQNQNDSTIAVDSSSCH